MSNFVLPSLEIGSSTVHKVDVSVLGSIILEGEFIDKTNYGIINKGEE